MYLQLFASAVTLLSLTVNGPQAQTKTDPKTLAECLKVVKEYPNIQQEAARKAGRKPDYQQYEKEAAALARKFASQFKPDTVEEADLLPLAELYEIAKQFDLAQTTIEKRLASPNLSLPERAKTLAAGVTIFVADPTDQNLTQAEIYAAQLDALPSAAIRQQIFAHYELGGFNSKADIESRVEHSEKILALFKKLSPAERKTFIKLGNSAYMLAKAYENVAAIQSNRGFIDQAIAILKEGRSELLDTPRVVQPLEQAIQRYSLIGKPGVPLKGEYWFNAAPQTKQLELRGRVSLVQFTAHWCGPCRKSYPGMLRLHEQYNKRGLDVIFATELYGYFEQKENLKPEEEIAEDRRYFLEHLKLPFKIAIEARSIEEGDSKALKAASSNRSEYQVTGAGIPKFFLLDKQGIIRFILAVWNPASETQVKTLIETLLNEPDTIKR